MVVWLEEQGQTVHKREAVVNEETDNRQTENRSSDKQDGHTEK